MVARLNGTDVDLEKLEDAELNRLLWVINPRSDDSKLMFLFLSIVRN